MPYGFAITAILSLALSIMCLRVSSDAKFWRLRWMDLLGVMDVEHDRDLRKMQERQMASISLILFVLFTAVSISCSYWTFDEIRESRREKSSFECEIDMARKEIEGVRLKIRR